MSTEASDTAARQALLGTAAEHAVRDVPVLTPETTAAEARTELATRRYESLADIAVCGGPGADGARQLVGLLSIERLLPADDGARVGDLADRDPPVIAPGVDQEVAAWRAVEHGESSLAVVDAGRHLVGLIPPRRLLAVLLEEHDEDMARLGGYLKGTSRARSAAEEPVPRRLVHRLPWLLLGLLGVLASASLVSAFEGRLEQNVALAFFLPGVVYLADAVGTQTEALVIRGLTSGVHVRVMAARESVTGLVVGLVIAASFWPLTLLYADAAVGLAAALALLAACAVASVVGMVLPLALHRLGRDPAYGSGPLATIIQDLFSILIYFATAILIVG